MRGRPGSRYAGSSWWRRNRLWLALLVPLLLLAMASSTFRLTRIYLPHEWSRPHTSAASWLDFEQDVVTPYGVAFHRKVRVEVVRVVPTGPTLGVVAADGAELYLLELRFSAEPDVVLGPTCEVVVLDRAGTEYLPGKGVLVAPDKLGAGIDRTCTPSDAPGPQYVASKQVTPSENERPRSWLYRTALGLPPGVQPDRVAVRWDRPDYAVVTIPR